MRERDVEQYLVSEVRAIGGRAYKLACPGTNGMPDRMVCLPGGRIVFVELKAPGKQARALQRARQKALRDMGFTVFGAVDRPAMVDAIIDYCRELMGGNTISDTADYFRELLVGVIPPSGGDGE